MSGSLQEGPHGNPKGGMSTGRNSRTHWETEGSGDWFFLGLLGTESKVDAAWSIGNSAKWSVSMASMALVAGHDWVPEGRPWPVESVGLPLTVYKGIASNIPRILGSQPAFVSRNPSVQ